MHSATNRGDVSTVWPFADTAESSEEDQEGAGRQLVTAAPPAPAVELLNEDRSMDIQEYYY